MTCFTATMQPRCTLPGTSTTSTASRSRAGSPRCAAALAGGAAAMACTAAAAVVAAAPVERPREKARRGAAAVAAVAQMWRLVQGSGDWDGLLEPLHPVLRDELVRYGELVGACYRALDVDPSSARYMGCKFGRERMLEEAGVAGAGYEVTRYIYAAPDVSLPPAMVASTSGRSASWMGYVAVSTNEQTRRLGRRDILVSFRGTVTPAEWAADLMSSLVPPRLHPSEPRPDDVRVQSGFLNLYTSADSAARSVGAGSCRDQLLREVSRLVAAFGEEDVSVTLAGHSMGGALALLLAYDLAGLGLNSGAGRRDPVPVTVFSFGGPRVGNAAFKARCDELCVKVLRVSNVRDPVTMLPGVFLNEATTRGRLLGAWSGACYTHVGVELPLDFISFRDLGSVHDLGTYVASLRTADGEVANAAAAAVAGVLAKAMEFVGRRSTGDLSRHWHWHDAARQMGDVVLSSGLI